MKYSNRQGKSSRTTGFNDGQRRRGKAKALQAKRVEKEKYTEPLKLRRGLLIKGILKKPSGLACASLGQKAGGITGRRPELAKKVKERISKVQISAFT